MIADAINGAILRLYTALKSEDGQTFVEYSLIGVLIAVVLAAVLDHVRGSDRRRTRHHRRQALSTASFAAAGAGRACRRPFPTNGGTHAAYQEIRGRSGDGRVRTRRADLLFLILFGIIQFGIAFMNSVALTDAVRAGARKAAVSRTAADPTQATTTAVLGAATDLDQSKLSVNVTSDWVSGNTVTVDATYPYRSTSSASSSPRATCTARRPSGSSKRRT